jgi:aconitase A
MTIFPLVHPTHLASAQRYPNACSRLKQCPQITALPRSPQDKAKLPEIAQNTLAIAYLCHGLENLIRVSQFHRAENRWRTREHAVELGMITCTNTVLKSCLPSTI